MMSLRDARRIKARARRRILAYLLPGRRPFHWRGGLLSLRESYHAAWARTANLEIEHEKKQRARSVFYVDL